MKVLVINSGSSSIKFQYFDVSEGSEKVLLKGMVDCIGMKNCEFSINGKKEAEIIKNHEEGIAFILSHIPKKDVEIIGHRVVHGGEKYKDAVIIDEDVIKTIEELSSLAPLHNPPNLAGILACQKIMPKTPQVAVFDTAFHSTIPKEAYMYGLPYSYYEKSGIRKYGFHGTSHEHMLLEVSKLLKKDKGKINMISCHLGNGSSICAIKEGKSVDTSMGFTPLAGIVMGTRSGDVDPGIITYIQKKENLTAEQVEKILNKDSGLLGISGSNDMRNIWAAAKNKDPQSLLTLDLLAYSIIKYVGAYAAILGNVDAIVFTGGLGENAFYIREKVIKYLEPMGVNLDREKNEKNEQIISTFNSTMKVFVIKTNEELMIAKESVDVLRKYRTA